MRKAIRLFDKGLRHALGVFEFCEAPDCLLRVRVTLAPHNLALQGWAVPKGVPILELHLWNEHIPPLAPSGPDLVWAVQMRRRLTVSFQSLADQVQRDPRFANVQAVGGITVLLSPGNDPGGEKLFQRLGFRVFPYYNPLGSFGEFWENFYSWWIMWAFNPATLRHRRLIGLQRSEVWMPIDEFISRKWVSKKEANMSVTSDALTDKTARLTLRLLGELFSGDVTQKVGVRLWDGTRWPDEAPYPATLVLKHPGALRAMLLPGTEVGLGEAYLYDDFDIEGDIESVFGLADSLAENMLDWRKKLNIGRDLVRLPASDGRRQARRGPARLSGRKHSVQRDQQAVTYHYDVSNDFYALWLDQRMVYSCAYFHSSDEDLDSAQEQKLDYICRKLRLTPGQRLLDIGCGWGGLVMHAAQHYGVNATGITLSQPQAELANRRIAEANLSDRCRVEVRDYRQVNEPEGYDALVSVGMFEHVGAALLPSYFARAWQLLKPGGAFLNHGIASWATEKSRRGPTFSNVYVFPDGELTPINVTLHAAEEAGFEVRDVESLREHYALTLRHWVRRLEAQHDQALQFVDEPTYRVWRLFMSGSAYGFSTARLNVYQALLIKSDQHGSSRLPLTRVDWYD